MEGEIVREGVMGLLCLLVKCGSVDHWMVLWSWCTEMGCGLFCLENSKLVYDGEYGWILCTDARNMRRDLPCQVNIDIKMLRRSISKSNH